MYYLYTGTREEFEEMKTQHPDGFKVVVANDAFDKDSKEKLLFFSIFTSSLKLPKCAPLTNEVACTLLNNIEGYECKVLPNGLDITRHVAAPPKEITKGGSHGFAKPKTL